MSDFENPTNSNKEDAEEKEYLEKAPPEVLKERAETLLGTIDACLDNLEGLKQAASMDESTPKEQRGRRVELRDLIDDHVNQVKSILDTGKIKLEDGLTFLGKEKHSRIQELFERGVMDYIVNNNLN